MILANPATSVTLSRNKSCEVPKIMSLDTLILRSGRFSLILSVPTRWVLLMSAGPEKILLLLGTAPVQHEPTAIVVSIRVVFISIQLVIR